MPRKTGLKLFLKTWPLKNKSKNNEESKEVEIQRPLTATLEKPTILDIRYLRTIDMSLIRKEFLSITNLCRIPLVIQTSKADIHSKDSSIIIKRPLSLPPPRLKRNKTKKISKRDKLITSSNSKMENNSNNGDCISDLDVSIATNTSGENERIFTYNKNKVCSAKSKLPKKISLDDHNNNNNNNQTKTNKTSNNHKITNKSIKAKLQPTENAALSQEKTVLVPEPCRTCGRSDQPERFHSHPASSFKRKNIKMENNSDSNNKISIVKSTVQKPVAIKYQSKVKDVPRNAIIKSPLPAQKLVHTPPTGVNQSSQQSLTPCLNCGRTFFPDRLLVHQRSCKSTTMDVSGNKKTSIPTRKISNENSFKVENNQLNNNDLTPIRSPLSEKCQICGKQFGKHSIKIHERQCLKKMQTENDKSSLSSSKGKSLDKPSILKNANDRPISSPRAAHLIPCYICGRLFTLASIKIHEPQCLKKWRLENDKLPPDKQRKEPTKPLFSYKEDGTLDMDQMIEDSWQEHLNQLVPCSICGRTFNPDRVDIHERNCKGKGF